MDTNGTCCDDPKNKLHMAPSASSAIALMPAIATAAASNVSSTNSNAGPLSSTTPSSTLHSNQSSSSSTLSTTAITSTAEPTPASTGRTKLAIGLGVGFGVGALILLFWVIYAYHCRKRGQERFQRSEARARIDAVEMVNRANMGVSGGWSSPFNRRKTPENSQQAVRSSAESAKSESAPTTVSRLASSGHHAESQPPSQLPTALPNSQIEQVEPRTDSAVDREPTAELEPETLESEQHDSTSQQPDTSNRSETLTSAQLDGASSQSPDTEKVAPRAQTPEEGSKGQEQPQEEGTSAAKPAENLQVEDEVQRQWSWQHGDDEHMQQSLEEQIETSQETPE